MAKKQTEKKSVEINLNLSEKKNPSTKIKSGRPSTNFTDEQVHELGREMVEWLQDRLISGKPVFHLTEWYLLHKKMLYVVWDMLRRREDFRQYYQSAMEMMTLATLQNQKLETAYGSRFLGIYSRDLREHEKLIKQENAEIEAAAKAKEVSNLTDQEIELNKQIVAAAIARQARNMEDRSNNRDK